MAGACDERAVGKSMPMGERCLCEFLEEKYGGGCCARKVFERILRKESCMNILLAEWMLKVIMSGGFEEGQGNCGDVPEFIDAIGECILNECGKFNRHLKVSFEALRLLGLAIPPDGISGNTHDSIMEKALFTAMHVGTCKVSRMRW